MRIKTVDMYPNISGVGIGTYHIFGEVYDVQVRANSSVSYTPIGGEEQNYVGVVSIFCQFFLRDESNEIELTYNDIPSRVAIPIEIWDDEVAAISVESSGAERLKDLALQVLLIELDRQSVFGIGVEDWEVVD